MQGRWRLKAPHWEWFPGCSSSSRCLAERSNNGFNLWKIEVTEKHGANLFVGPRDDPVLPYLAMRGVVLTDLVCGRLQPRKRNGPVCRLLQKIKIGGALDRAGA